MRFAQRATGPAPAVQEDSGLIDLRALKAAAEKARSPGPPAQGAELTPLPVVRRLAVYPLGAPPDLDEAVPPGPPGRADLPRFRGKPRLIAALAVVASAAGVAALVLLRDPPRAERAAVPDLPAVGDRAATSGFQGRPESLPATDPSPPTAIPVETAVPRLASALPATAAPVRRPPPASKKPAPASKTAASTATAPARTPPPADTCKGNLLCAMKRATAGR